MPEIQTVLLILLSLFAILLVLGVPISIAITFSSIIPMLLYMPFNIVMMSAAQNFLAGMNKYSFMALTLFMLSGSIMNETGLAKRLVNLAKLLVGGIPGSIAHINVVSNMLFGALSGSAVAAASAIGKVMIPLQEEEGYNKEFAAAVNIASSPIGFLIPPSGMLILYSTLTGGAASITALFFAGYFPGFLLAFVVMIVSFIIAKKEKYGTTSISSWRERRKILVEGFPALILIILIIVGMLAGIFTPTEASGIAAFYSLVLALIYKSITMEKLWIILEDTVVMTGAVLFLVSSSAIMSWLFAFSQIPNLLSEVLLSIAGSKEGILIMINIILLIAGMFMDVGPINVIFTPLFFPIIMELGVDPVHFGIIMITNSAVGVCTPPVGNVLFVGSSIANVRVDKVIPWIIPMVIAQIIVVFIVTFWESAVLFIPRALGLY